ncbi:MAG: PTS sugar transporter subunit IIC [Armatimonadetes bacterium]|nr:PTS sugar transporter subunit IIC [Armatimonadota bacterium]
MNPFLEALGRLTRQKHLIALRDGIISAMPIILVGSTFFLLGAQNQLVSYLQAKGASNGFFDWYLANSAVLLVPYRLTMGILSLYVTFTVAASLARQYNLPPLPQGLGAVATFLMTAMPVRLAYSTAEGAPKPWMIPISSSGDVHTPLGAEGLFLAIICALGMVEIARLIIRPKDDAPEPAGLEDEMGVPRAVGDAFRSFLPTLVAVTIVWWMRHVMGWDLVTGIIHLLKPMDRLGDSLVAVIVVNLALHVLQFAGVHGVSVINAAFLAFWMQWLVQNANAYQAGQPLPHITAYPFFQWFVWIGGAGATLPLALMMLISRHPHVRHIGRIAIVPSLFNVNEPLIFGLPVVLNPSMAIPFVAAPVACGTVAYLAISAGLVGAPIAEVPWVLPCVVGGWLSTADLRAVLLVLVNLALSAAIWFPFLRAYERGLAEGKGTQTP